MERPIFNRLGIHDKQKAILETLDHNGKNIKKNCQDCGACCFAFSVPSLKNHGEMCQNLEIKDGLKRCRIYEQRPEECKKFNCRDMKQNTKRQITRLNELIAAQYLLST